MSFTKIENGMLRCTLCSHRCLIASGSCGVCRIRCNDNGSLSLPLKGFLAAIAVDPMEKKPLYHYHPGQPIFSIGFWGCNFQCPFCQNHTISQEIRETGSPVSPKDLINSVKKADCNFLAFTYSEPSIHIEYIMESAGLAHQNGIGTVLVTNGNLLPDAATELLSVIDAVNVDLKSFEHAYYKKQLRGDLETVKRFIEIACGNCHVEITTLVIPGINDSPEEILRIADFIEKQSREIPLHLSCYFPAWKSSQPATSPELVLQLADFAHQKLDYVYTGNMTNGRKDTLCPDCESLLIHRNQYQTTITGLTGSRCSKCGRPVPIIQ